MDVEALYKEHAAVLFRYALRLGGDAELAADVVHDTFVRLVERPPRQPAVKAWLFRVATNLVLERRRTQRRRLQLLARSPGRVPVGDAPDDPATGFERLQRRRSVRAALDALSPRDQAVLLMQAEGFTHQEIAAAVGTTTGSVGTILARALRKLARALPAEAGG